MEGDFKREAFRVAGYVMLGAAVSVAAVTFHLTAQGNRKLADAKDALASRDRSAAVEALSDAAGAYVPGAAHVRAAHRDLEIIARAAEIRGDGALSLKAWDALRRSILSVRHLYQPFGETLVEAEKSVVRIRGKALGAADSNTLVRRPKDPSKLLSVFLFFSLCAWIFGASLWAAVPLRKDRAAWIRPEVSALICLIGLTSWLFFAFVIG